MKECTRSATDDAARTMLQRAQSSVRGVLAGAYDRLDCVECARLSEAVALLGELLAETAPCGDAPTVDAMMRRNREEIERAGQIVAAFRRATS